MIVFTTDKCRNEILKQKLNDVQWDVSSESSASFGKVNILYEERNSASQFWKALPSDTEPWITFSFDSEITISQMILQGSGPILQDYVKKFLLEQSSDNVVWKKIKSSSDDYEFKGPTDSYFPEVYIFSKRIICLHLKMIIKEFVGSSAVRLALFGCNEHVPNCFSSSEEALSSEFDGPVKCFKNWNIVAYQRNYEEKSPESWNIYRKGFITSKEYSTGNDALSNITTFHSYQARIDMWSTTNQHIHAEFKSIVVLNYLKLFQLQLSEFASGIATDGSLTNVNFYTIDKDTISTTCSANYKTGWWFNENNCQSSSILRGKNAFWKVNQTPFKSASTFLIDKFLFRITSFGRCKFLS